MNLDLCNAQHFCVRAIHADFLLCLANAVAWLDPLWAETDDWYDDTDYLTPVLLAMRQVFPNIYAEAMELLHEGALQSQVERLICQSLEKKGIPVEEIEFLAYGIPLPAYGAELETTQFYETNPELLPLLAVFGVQPNLEGYVVEVTNQVYKAGRFIGEQLCVHPDPRYQDMGWLLLWLFGWTGNSVVDLTYEFLWEYEPLRWTPEDTAFALAMIQEAETIMQRVATGTAFLIQQPTLLETLKHHIHRIYRRLAKGKSYAHLRLEWPALADGFTGATEPNP